MSTVQTPAKNTNSRGDVALIAGPTASGKSDLAVRLALALKDSGREAVIINADSAQVYADLTVLSARPGEAEMHGAAHRLFGTWDGAQACSAADWAEAAKAQIAAAHDAGAVPVLVGGTGLYIRTLLDGIAPIPAIDPAIRERVRSMATPAAYAALQAADPARAAVLAPADGQRIARALEVVQSTGRTQAAWQEQLAGGIADQITLAPLILLPDRTWLNTRCDARFAAMLAGGAVEEVAALLMRGLDPGLPVMRAIGVSQIADYLRANSSLAQTTTLGQIATRQYAKRQYTWLRHQPPTHWVRIQPENVDIHANFASLFHK